MRAFTLLEVIVYIALLSIMAGSLLLTLASLSASLARVQAESAHLQEDLLMHDMADRDIHLFGRPTQIEP